MLVGVVGHGEGDVPGGAFNTEEPGNVDKYEN